MLVTAEDLVVLLDEQGNPVGQARRDEVHTGHTPLHLAFSCYLFDGSGRVLLTRRALSKRTWPGVWTNACCGHPRPGEDMVAAVRRRLSEELGAEVGAIDVVLPGFRYQAVDASGIRENEICPVHVATLTGEVDPDPAEVMEHEWIDPRTLIGIATSAPRLLSPWSALQIPQLHAVGALAG